MIRGIVLENILDGDSNVALRKGAVVIDDGSDHVLWPETGDLIYLDKDERDHAVDWDEEES